MSTSKSMIVLHSEKQVDYTVHDCKWIPSTASFMVCGTKPDMKGSVETYELTKTNDKRDIRLVTKISRPSGVKCMTFAGNICLSRQVALAEFSGRLSVIDLEHLNKDDPSSDVFKTCAHPGVINCLDGIGVGSGVCELVTGGDDGVVRVWDSREPTKAVMAMKAKNTRVECWSVGFGGADDADGLFVCSGYANGDLKLFDMRNSTLFWEVNLLNGVCSLEFDRKEKKLNRVAVGCLQSQLTLIRFDQPNNHVCLNKKICAAGSTVWSVRHIPQNRSLITTCSGSGHVNLWKYENNDLIQKGSALLSTQPLNSIDWSKDMVGLGCVGAFDQCVRVVLATKLNTL